MELRTYWAIILRRIWVIILVVAVLSAYSAYEYYHLHKTPGALKVYHSEVTLQIGLQATSRLTNQNYSDYITTSEAMADEFATGPVLTTNEFDTRVVQQIQNDLPQIKQSQYYQQDPNLDNLQNPGAIGGALSATRAHRLVTISVTWNTPTAAWAIAQAVGEVSAAHIGSYINYAITNDSNHLPSDGLQPVVIAKIVSQAAGPSTLPGPSANRPSLLIVLVLVGLIIGIALAFLVEYLDERIRSKEEIVDLLQLPIYGEVPHAPSLGQGKSSRSSTAEGVLSK